MTPPTPTDAPETGLTEGARPPELDVRAKRTRRRRLALWGVAAALVGLGLLAWSYAEPLARWSASVFTVVSDRQQLTLWLDTVGPWAPVFFIGVQILQVILAPVPGEATGIIGGFLFGVGPGFFYSSIGLACGSWINLAIGRLLGERVVRRLVPERQMARFDGLIHRQGVWTSLVLFVFPGFPKDYLCLILGISHLPLWLLLLLASVGRMPGTLLLSIQGGAIGERQWGVLWAVTAATVVGLVFSYRYRVRISAWVRRHSAS